MTTPTHNQTPMPEDREQLRRFLDAFANELGVDYFLEGLTFSEAREKHRSRPAHRRALEDARFKVGSAAAPLAVQNQAAFNRGLRRG